MGLGGERFREGLRIDDQPGSDSLPSHLLPELPRVLGQLRRPVVSDSKQKISSGWRRYHWRGEIHRDHL